jgi:transcriptional regulator with XRE-family HTH domain
VCNTVYPGTREGFILVVDLPPSNGDVGGHTSNGTLPDADADGVGRRAELADFLRTRRANLQPDDVGLPTGGRRRTPGLRREEVASLAGVGTTWYTWLEQGRDVRASLDVLEALGRALRLTPAEHGHLILLGRGEQAPACKAPIERVSVGLRRVIENLRPGPAYVLGRRWDYLAWNPAASAVFGWDGLPRDGLPVTRNHVWLTFMDPARRELIPDWMLTARTLLAKFRADSARHIGDPAFEQLISTLQGSSPEFRKWWGRHEVSGGGEGRKELNHPIVGRLVFDHVVFRHDDTSEQRLIIYSPTPEDDTEAKLERLLAGYPPNR